MISNLLLSRFLTVGLRGDGVPVVEDILGLFFQEMFCTSNDPNIFLSGLLGKLSQLGVSCFTWFVPQK